MTAAPPPHPPIDPALDKGYNARASVASFEDEYAALVALSRAAQRDLPVIPDLVFDQQSGMALDLYAADAPGAGAPRPVVLWIHGGYWRFGNRADNAFAAPGLAAAGVAVAVMDYGLAPETPLAEIVRQTRQAVAWLAAEGAAYGLDPRRIHVAGSSAGGHLAAMTLAEGWRAPLGLPEQSIGAVLGLSGLYDLRPLRRTQVNGWLSLDEAAAAALSPMDLIPAASDARLLLSVGGLETSAFQDQTNAFAAAWRAAGHDAAVIDMPGFNHFDISGDLARPDSALVRPLVAAIRAFHG